MEDFDDGSLKLPEVAAWNVVFLAGPRETWWDWLTRPAFRHVCAFGYDPQNDGWIIMDPRRSHLQVLPVDDEGFGRWMAHHRPRITDIRQVQVGNARKCSPWLGDWCTITVKRLCGVSCGAFTPEALWRELVARNCPQEFMDGAAP